MGKQLTIDEELDFLRAAIKINAPSWKEKEVVALLDNIFEGTPARILIDDVGNFVATSGSGKPIILLSSHMDTIDQPLPFKEDGDWIAGRGAVDCRPSLLAMALATRRMIINGHPGTIIFSGIVAEEVSTAGIEHFLNDSLKPSCAIFGEPTALKICIAYKGRAWFEISVLAKPGHVAAAWIHVNGIEVMHELKEKIAYNLAELIKHKKLSPFYTPRATLTTMETDTIPNMLPRKVRADLDIRFPPTIPKETIGSIVETARKEIEAKHRKRDDTLSIETKTMSMINGVRVSTKTRLCKNLRAAIEKVTEQKSILVKKTGTTFMNHIAEHHDIPIVTFGPGDPTLEHGDAERISKSKFLQAVLILENFLKNQLRDL